MLLLRCVGPWLLLLMACGADNEPNDSTAPDGGAVYVFR